MSLVEAQGQEGGVGTPEAVDGSQAAEILYTRNTPLANGLHVYVREVEEWVREICTEKGVPASHQRRFLAAVVCTLEWEDVQWAIYDQIEALAKEVIQTLADSCLKSSDVDDGFYTELGSYSEWTSVPQLLDGADSYLPLIADEIAADISDDSDC